MSNCSLLVTNETPKLSTEHILKRKCLTVVFIISVGPVEKTLWLFFPVCGVVGWLSADRRITK